MEQPDSIYYNLYDTIIVNKKDNYSKDVEYRNAVLNQSMPIGTSDYENYFTRTLITHGTNDINLSNINTLYNTKIEELYNEKFKKIYLYNLKRNIKNIYNNIDDLHNMNIIGFFDFCSASLSLETAKRLPTFELFGEDKYNEILDKIDVDIYKPEIIVDETIDGEDPIVDGTSVIDDGLKPIEQVFQEKIDILVTKINEKYNNLLIDLKNKNDILFANTLPVILKLFDLNADDRDKMLVLNIHKTIIDIFGLMAYSLSVSKLISTSFVECVPLLIIESKVNVLKNVSNIGELNDLDYFISLWGNYPYKNKNIIIDSTEISDLDDFYYQCYENLKLMKTIFDKNEIVDETDSEESIVIDRLQEWNDVSMYVSTFILQYKTRANISSLKYKQILDIDVLIKSFIKNYNYTINSDLLLNNTI